MLSDTELEDESWRILIRTSQKFFPAKKRKGLFERKICNIRLGEFRIDPNKMMQDYNTKFLPILGRDEPLVLKLTSDRHVQDSFLDKVHLSIRTSLRNLSRGRFGILYPEARAYLHQIVNSCPKCLEQSEWCYQQQLDNNSFERAFQNISLDPLGHLEVKAFSNSRKLVKVWLLLIRYMDTGAVLCQIMESMETRSVMNALLRLQLRMGKSDKYLWIVKPT